MSDLIFFWFVNLISSMKNERETENMWQSLVKIYDDPYWKIFFAFAIS